MAYELILQDIELNENTINDNTFDIWFDYQTAKFIAHENIRKGRSFEYEMTDLADKIANENRMEILEYRLGKVTPEDQVTIADIFMHRKFIQKI